MSRQPAYLNVNYEGSTDLTIDKLLEQRIGRAPHARSRIRNTRNLEWKFRSKAAATSTLRSLHRLSQCGFLLYVTADA